MLRNIVINTALVLASILVFFGGGELLLRFTVANPNPVPPGIYRSNPDPAISYELKPNLRKFPAFRGTVTTDERGFRSPPIDPKKPTIAMLGDSITFGFGVNDDQTLASRLAASFPTFNVVNTGVAGYALAQEVRTFREKFLPLRPSLLILTFHPQDFGRTISWLDSEGFLHPPGWTPGERHCDPITQGILNEIPGKCWLDLHSAFYTAVKKFVNRRILKEAQREDAANSLASVYDDTVTDAQLSDVASRLQALDALVGGSVPRLFVLWPDRNVHIIARQKLRDIARARGWTFLDLYEFFGNRMETLPWDSVHPSPESIMEAATIIGDTLKHDTNVGVKR
ncbi:hypothetical protein HY285_03695 [Candidatus Peregrinibacteria bacterium]|nr:hypothetical protein [Candidatus Peregrinibacteria bacterium]MBI3816619.1 hypothetical protein [Candidatus Peregrinibacteria bacterium]